MIDQPDLPVSIYEHIARVTNIAEAKTAEWKKEQKKLSYIRAHKQADTGYLVEGVKLMELATRTAELFKQMSDDEKRELVSLVPSNLQIIDRKVF